METTGPITFSGGLNLSPADAVSTGFNFMNNFGGWTMLVAGLIIAPVAIGFVLWILKKIPKFTK